MGCADFRLWLSRLWVEPAQSLHLLILLSGSLKEAWVARPVASDWQLDICCIRWSFCTSLWFVLGLERTRCFSFRILYFYLAKSEMTHYSDSSAAVMHWTWVGGLPTWPWRLEKTFMNWIIHRLVFFFFKHLFIWLSPGLCCGTWDLVPWPGIEPRPPALGAGHLTHWAAREVPAHRLVSFWPCLAEP